ncbi:MAG TPA: heparinase II/III family protein [Gemmatimonadales bacterium]|nr:heparinase II/III family protein [Gemmatimonadales bacterium]
MGGRGGALVVTAEDLAARKEVVAASPDLQRLLGHIRERARPLLERMPHVPEHKALLSSDGGVCADDGIPLTFDPWSPTEHRCPRCGKRWRGDRYSRYWARFQHLWLAERAVDLATIAGLGEQEDGAAANRAIEILTTYAARYWRYPNRDNVLGPSRLFFSTYIESIWTCNYLAAAMMLRGAGLLDDATAKSVHQVAEEAATLIGDYDEGFSNRQTWNNAALTAVAVWFEDEELAQRAIEGETGLIAHAARGYGRDGMWFEGENYHLFALRGLLTGASWARLAGLDFWSDQRLGPRIASALRAPMLTALPDFTFPARKDARFGVSLAQPAYLELWEIGLAGLASGGGAVDADPNNDLLPWLGALYRLPPPEPELFEYYLHDFGAPRTAHGARSSLSWWSLLEMLPELPAPAQPWQPQSVLLESQGLAVLRRGNRYVSLEAGSTSAGHGHPDQLHLTLFADGVHWLPDPGTGGYVTRDLFWYRSSRAHNAPRIDGESLTDETRCECFAEQGDWGWVRGRSGDLSRTVVTGPSYLVDVVELPVRDEHLVELSWHFGGAGEIDTKGRWVTAELADEFVTRVERFLPDASGPVVVQRAADGAQLTAHVIFDGELLRAEGPPLPGGVARKTFYVVRIRGRNVRIVTVLDAHSGLTTVRMVRTRGEVVEVETTAGLDRHRPGNLEWTIESGEHQPVVLRGAREARPPFKPMVEIDMPTPVTAPAFRVGVEPPLDGTLEGFEVAEPLQLALEDQYRRSEDAYPGPDDFSALAYAAWDERALYLAVDVTKPDLCLRPPHAEPLRLDNDPDDIHSDGLQIFIDAADAERDGGAPVGYLIVPQVDGRGVRVACTSDTRGTVDTSLVHGEWRRTDRGYRVTVGIPWTSTPGVHPHAGARVRFDLIVNELLPGRMRRTGQLVWSGGGGWVWLRGDRQDPSRFGVLELVV